MKNILTVSVSLICTKKNGFSAVTLRILDSLLLEGP